VGPRGPAEMVSTLFSFSVRVFTPRFQFPIFFLILGQGFFGSGARKPSPLSLTRSSNSVCIMLYLRPLNCIPFFPLLGDNRFQTVLDVSDKFAEWVPSKDNPTLVSVAPPPLVGPGGYDNNFLCYFLGGPQPVPKICRPYRRDIISTFCIPTNPLPAAS